MFHRELYNHNKLLFFTLLSFLLLFLFLNLKWGAVATPVYQFGMFSGPVHRSDTQKIYQIYVNNRLIQLNSYPFARRDMLLVALEQYTNQKQKNAATFTTMNNLFSKFGLRNVINEKAISNNITDKQFTNWYKYLMQQVIGYKVEKLDILFSKYTWSGGLQRIGQPEKLSFIVD